MMHVVFADGRRHQVTGEASNSAVNRHFVPQRYRPDLSLSRVPKFLNPLHLTIPIPHHRALGSANPQHAVEE